MLSLNAPQVQIYSYALPAASVEVTDALCLYRRQHTIEVTRRKLTPIQHCRVFWTCTPTSCQNVITRTALGLQVCLTRTLPMYLHSPALLVMLWEEPSTTGVRPPLNLRSNLRNEGAAREQSRRPVGKWRMQLLRYSNQESKTEDNFLLDFFSDQ